jgi:esterase/lipase superfamily enzyme
MEVPASEILELGIRELLADLGLKADTVPVLRGVGELAAVLVARATEAKPPTSRREVIEESPWRGDGYSVAQEDSELRETPDAWIVPVFYGTDRDRTRAQEPAKLFGTGRGPLSFGWAEVSLPKQRDKGELPAPAWWKPWQRKEDASRFVLLLSVHPLEREPFVAELKSAVEKADVPEALVFIHGFNVTFEEAAERAAQVAFDLEFKGVPMVFSWPSRGNPILYSQDENDIEWAIPHFEEFLRLALDESGARTVHVIAHSMGNRALARALGTLQARVEGTGGAKLRQIIFAAPDIDRDTFVHLADQFQGKAERFTLYGSANDRALKMSKLFHGYPRAGDSGKNLALADGVDSIDASAVDTSFLGHSYYGSRSSILSDISYLLREGLPPDRRFGFRVEEREKKRYWVYKP